MILFTLYAAHTLARTFEAKSNWKVFSKKFLIKNALWIHWKSSSENQIFFGIAHLLRIGTKFHFLHVSKETFKKEKNFYSKAEQNWPKLPCLWLYDKWIFLEKTLDNLCHSFCKETSAKSFWHKVIAISYQMHSWRKIDKVGSRKLLLRKWHFEELHCLSHVTQHQESQVWQKKKIWSLFLSSFFAVTLKCAKVAARHMWNRIMFHLLSCLNIFVTRHSSVLKCVSPFMLTLTVIQKSIVFN